MGMGDTGSNSDGENVSLSSGAQAENIQQRTGRETSLVMVWNDGWIEQSSGFQGVFGQEIGADLESSLFGQSLIRQHQVADLFEAFQEEIANLLVSLGEFG